MKARGERPSFRLPALLRWQGESLFFAAPRGLQSTDWSEAATVVPLHSVGHSNATTTIAPDGLVRLHKGLQPGQRVIPLLGDQIDVFLYFLHGRGIELE
jgi:hypothetical protein